jgi:hypothetical protein
LHKIPAQNTVLGNLRYINKKGNDKPIIWMDYESALAECDLPLIRQSMLLSLSLSLSRAVLPCCNLLDELILPLDLLWKLGGYKGYRHHVLDRRERIVLQVPHMEHQLRWREDGESFYFMSQIQNNISILYL